MLMTKRQFYNFIRDSDQEYFAINCFCYGQKYHCPFSYFMEYIGVNIVKSSCFNGVNIVKSSCFNGVTIEDYIGMFLGWADVLNVINKYDSPMISHKKISKKEALVFLKNALSLK